MLIRSVVAKHVAVRGALEGLKAGFALDREGSSVLRTSYQRQSAFEFGMRFSQISAGSSPPLGPYHLCDRAFAVLFERCQQCHLYSFNAGTYLAPLPIAANVVGKKL